MSNRIGSTPRERDTPTIENRKVPVRRANAAYRSREYLSEKEVGALMAAAASVGRHGARDAALILVAYRHGLRVSELVSLRWDQVDLQQGLLHVTRLKHGIASVHPLRGPELRALRRLQRDYPETAYVFVSERKAPLTTDAIRKIVGRAGRHAGIEFPIHPHMLRHATGYKLANDGQDTRAIQHYLGHRNIQHTTRYTELASDRFKNFGTIEHRVRSGLPSPARRDQRRINAAMCRYCGQAIGLDATRTGPNLN